MSSATDAAPAKQARFPAPLDISGRRFGRWTALYFTGKYDKHKKRLWRCRCECGTEKDVPVEMLMSGKSRSCGCLRREAGKTTFRKALLLEANKKRKAISERFKTIEVPNPDDENRRTYRLCREMARHRQVDPNTVKAWCNDGRFNSHTFPENTRVYLPAPYSEWAELPLPFASKAYYADEEPSRTQPPAVVAPKTWSWDEAQAELGIGHVTLWKEVNEELNEAGRKVLKDEKLKELERAGKSVDEELKKAGRRVLKENGDLTKVRDKPKPTPAEHGRSRPKKHTCRVTRVSDGLIRRIRERRGATISAEAITIEDAGALIRRSIPAPEGNVDASSGDDAERRRRSDRRMVIRLLAAGRIKRFEPPDGAPTRASVRRGSGRPNYSRKAPLIDLASVEKYLDLSWSAQGDDEVTVEQAAEALRRSAAMVFVFIREGLLQVVRRRKIRTVAGAVRFDSPLLSRKGVDELAEVLRGKSRSANRGGRPGVERATRLKRLCYWQRAIGQTWAQVLKAVQADMETWPQAERYQIYEKQEVMTYAKRYAEGRRDHTGCASPLPWPPNFVPMP